jgi:hypothetical protein
MITVVDLLVDVIYPDTPRSKAICRLPPLYLYIPRVRTRSVPLPENEL